MSMIFTCQECHCHYSHVFLLFVLGVQLIRHLALANRNLFRNIHTNTHSADFSQSKAVLHRYGVRNREKNYLETLYHVDE